MDNYQLPSSRSTISQKDLHLKRSPKYDRPITAKQRDFKVMARSVPRNRPISATRSQKKRSNLEIGTLNARSTRNIANKIEMESLYESNLGLKERYNKVDEENTKLRTIITRLQNEAGKQESYIHALSSIPQSQSKQPTIKKMNIVRSLKNTVRDQKFEIQKLTEEKQASQRNMKASKIAELEIELQSYANECIRLRRHLEEMVSASIQSTLDVRKDTEEVEGQDQVIADLREENAQLSTALAQARSDLERWRDHAMTQDSSGRKPTLKKKSVSARNLRHGSNQPSSDQRSKVIVKKLQETIKQQNNEIQDHLGYIEHLKTQISPSKQESANMEFPFINMDPKLHRLLQQIQKYTTGRQITVQEFFSRFDSKNSGLVFVDKLQPELRRIGIKTKKFTIEKLSAYVNGKNQESISIQKLVEFYEQASIEPGTPQSTSSEDMEIDLQLPSHKKKMPTSFSKRSKSESPPLEDSNGNILKISKDDVRDLLSHIGMKMQLHRLPKSKLLVSLFGANFDKDRTITLQDLKDILAKKPFNFESENERNTLARYLLEPMDSNMFTNELNIKNLISTAKEIGGTLFMELEEWDVFKPEDEKEFDAIIARLVRQNQLTFQECCKGYDPDGTGFVNIDDFMEILETLELEFDEKCLQYMLLLFYSHEFDLNRVPYAQFIDAYSKMHGDETEDESYHSSQDETSIDEEERAIIVRDCLATISDKLRGRPATEFFQHEDGRLYPKELAQGLRQLNIPEFDKEVFVVLIESLQHQEEEEELCVDFQYFESLLHHYRDSDSVESPEPQTGDNTSREMERKISVLDSQVSATEQATPQSNLGQYGLERKSSGPLEVIDDETKNKFKGKISPDSIQGFVESEDECHTFN